MTKQKKIEGFEASIRTSKVLIEFFENHEGNLQEAEKEKLITMLKQEIHIHECWLIAAKAPTGW